MRKRAASGGGESSRKRRDSMGESNSGMIINYGVVVYAIEDWKCDGVSFIAKDHLSFVRGAEGTRTKQQH